MSDDKNSCGGGTSETETETERDRARNEESKQERMKERKKEGIGSLPGLAFSGSGVLRAAQCVEKPRSERCFVVCTEDSGRAGLR